MTTDQVPYETLGYIDHLATSAFVAEFGIEEGITTRARALTFFEDPQDGWAHGYDQKEFVFALSHVDVYGQAPTRWHQKILLRNNLVRKKTLNVGPYGTRTFLLLTAAGRQAFIYASEQLAMNLLGDELIKVVADVSPREFSSQALTEYLTATQPDYEQIPASWSVDLDMAMDLMMHNRFRDRPRELS